MNRERCRRPTRRSRVTHGTIGGKAERYVVRVQAGIEIRRMTGIASIRGIDVIAVVTSIAVLRNG